jgi:hypothetical protein
LIIHGPSGGSCCRADVGRIGLQLDHPRAVGRILLQGGSGCRADVGRIGLQLDHPRVGDLVAATVPALVPIGTGLAAARQLLATPALMAVVLVTGRRIGAPERVRSLDQAG